MWRKGMLEEQRIPDYEWLYLMLSMACIITLVGAIGTLIYRDQVALEYDTIGLTGEELEFGPGYNFYHISLYIAIVSTTIFIVLRFPRRVP